jgi:Mg2+ and Co2+ transporter CorA
MEARLISPAGVASLSMTEIRDVAARDGGTLWLDFDHTDEDSMELLGELIDVRPGDIQECHKGLRCRRCASTPTTTSARSMDSPAAPTDACISSR